MASRAAPSSLSVAGAGRSASGVTLPATGTDAVGRRRPGAQARAAEVDADDDRVRAVHPVNPLRAIVRTK